MNILIVFIAILLSIFSTAVMSFIAMATPIGPWIETTLVLIGTLIFRVGMQKFMQPTRVNRALGLTTIAGGIGGIVATACGFSFPTLYFLNKSLFNSWLQTPSYFCAIMAGLVLAAGSLGLIIAHVFEDSMLHDETMRFSVGELVQKMIEAQNQVRKSIELLIGATASIIWSVLISIAHVIPVSIKVLQKMSLGIVTVPALTIITDFVPMFLAIGFVTGAVLVVPLIVGIILKLFVIDTINSYLFPALSANNFLLAFGSGMVVQGALVSITDVPRFLKVIHKFFTNNQQSSRTNIVKKAYQSISRIEIIITMLFIGLFFYFFNFPLVGQLYLIVFTILCTQQLLMIAGKIGLAPLGRFATFVMVPWLFLFTNDPVQATLVATFVELCGGVAADSMFGRKLGQLAHLKRRDVIVFQWLGLVVSALVIGIIFWLLIHHFGLGAPVLLVQKAQGRALLINAHQFNYIVGLLGIITGFILKLIKVNPSLVLGGLFMSVDFSLILIIGGLLPKICKDPEEYYPFWSGVFAASSLWMIIKTLKIF